MVSKTALKRDMKFSGRSSSFLFGWIIVGVVASWTTFVETTYMGITTKSEYRKHSNTSRYRPNKDPSHRLRKDSLSYAMPAFDKGIVRNVTTQRGQTAYLHCVVNNIEDKTVSWIRRRDFHVLTVGLDTYTTENRFETSHVPSTNDWMLKIYYAQVHDSGIYECQVSSDPKISFFVNLNVVVAIAKILGAPDLYVREGSSINLTCIITLSPEPPLFIFWYHNSRMINYDTSKVEIMVMKGGQDTAISRLYIRDARVEDSGNYSCCPSNTDATSILVHVLQDEKQEAIQHDSGHTNNSSSPRAGLLLYLILIRTAISALVR